MCRAWWPIPFLLAGCSTAPVAGIMDTIDSHHRGKSDRDEPRPPPGQFGPASRTRVSDPPVDPPRDNDAPYDMPTQPVRRRGKTFEPKDKVRETTTATPAVRRSDPSPDDDDRRPDRGRVLPPPPLPASDERDDF